MVSCSNIIDELQDNERSCLCDDTRGCPPASTCMLKHVHTHERACTHKQKMWKLAFIYLLSIFYLTVPDDKGRNLQVYHSN